MDLLGLLFASIAYNTGAYCNRKHKQKEAVKKGIIIMKNSTKCKDINGKEIHEGSYIQTQIDGRLPDWFIGVQ